jgi:REP element-mobilizing transposase RayT
VLSPPRRRSLRLRQQDYAEPGAYFVTICTQDRMCILGDVIEGQMAPNALGAEVVSTWRELPDRFDGLELDECVVMPNHFHGILTLASPVNSISQIISAFKSLSASGSIQGAGRAASRSGNAASTTTSSATIMISCASANTSRPIRRGGPWAKKTQRGRALRHRGRAKARHYADSCCDW